MRTIVTSTVVDGRATPRFTEILCTDENNILVRLGGKTGSRLVAIPLSKQLPTYIKAGKTWYKLQNDHDESLQYIEQFRAPRKNVKFVEVPNPWTTTVGPADRDQREIIHDVLNKLVQLFFKEST